MQFLYARVSTSDQTAAHQIEQARAAGFSIDSMSTTLVEIAHWHTRQAKATKGADRDFHIKAAELLRDLTRRQSRHGPNIAAALAERKAQGKPLGRARVPAEIEDAIRAALRAGGKGMQAIAREIGVGTGTGPAGQGRDGKNIACSHT